MVILVCDMEEFDKHNLFSLIGRLKPTNHRPFHWNSLYDDSLTTKIRVSMQNNESNLRSLKLK